ncbi:MAG TPA: hypothetical protein VKB80_09490 [Kofleriaceae bacterium]|nr:hypothetical protein [Kofleriaceae bacterium]
MAIRSVVLALGSILVAACGHVSKADDVDDGGGGGGGGGSVEPGDGGDDGAADIDLIDDLEDGDGDIPARGGRTGSWFITSDTSGEVTPPVDGFVPTAGGAGGSEWCAGMSGSGFTGWGVHMGAFFDHERGEDPAPYDVGGHEGVAFRARGDTDIRVSLSTVQATSVEQRSGSCEPTEDTPCGDYHGWPATLTSDWQDYMLPLSGIDQEGWGVQVPFDPASVNALRFQVAGEAAFDLCVDDVRFY